MDQAFLGTLDDWETVVYSDRLGVFVCMEDRKWDFAPAAIIKCGMKAFLGILL